MLIISAKKHLNRIKICDKIIKRVEKVNTLLDGNAVRSKITDFRTALPTLAVPKENNRLEREFSLTAAP